MSKYPDKNKVYISIEDESLWKIWDEEDFSEGHVLLYNQETGEDATYTLDNFKKYFKCQK